MLIRLLLLLTLLLPLCSCEKRGERKVERPTVLVSVPPYAFFVKKIAEDTVTVETLVPVGANPHVYESTPREVQRHHNAALWVYLGESFDQKVRPFFTNTQILDVTEGISLLPLDGHTHCHHHDDGKDLHIWLSPKLAKIQAEKIAAALITLLPEEKARFAANLQQLLNELDTLDQNIATLLDSMSNQAILVSHPAFGYFCEDYHLTQLSIEMEGKDPLPQHVTQVLAEAKRYALQSVLLEPQYSNKGAELIAQALNLPTHMVDPYAENYAENLLMIAKVIHDGRENSDD
jgi:zinc transport system substrate-binding protein